MPLAGISHLVPLPQKMWARFNNTSMSQPPRSRLIMPYCYTATTLTKHGESRQQATTSPLNTAHTRCPISINNALPHQTQPLHQQPTPCHCHRQSPTCHVTIDKGCHVTDPTATTDKGMRWGARARRKAVRRVTARGPRRGGEVYRASTTITGWCATHTPPSFPFLCPQ